MTETEPTSALIGALVGRDRETALLDQLLAAGRYGSAVLSIVGGPGLGKTALTELARSRAEAAGTYVLAACGFEAEANLPFAGLHQLLRPVESRIETLPIRQAAAMRCAFGLSDEVAPDRFMIGLATLTLLSEVADERPLLLLVDDFPWLDRGSVQALGFAAHRLSTEHIAWIVAGREDNELASSPGRAAFRINLGPLDAGSANDLLDRQARPMARRLRSRVLAEAAGNPLALIELAGSVGSNAGRADREDAELLPTPRLERVFAGRLRGLPASSRRILILAAAADSSDVRPIMQAAATWALDGSAWDASERDGLITVVGDEVRFRHPVVRSSVYRSASVEERRAAHLALAAALHADPDRRAWHLAAAAHEPDEGVATALETTAERSHARAGYGAAAASLERAAALSPDRSQQARRLVLAAEMAVKSGQAAWVEELAARIPALTDEADLRVRALLAVLFVRVNGDRDVAAETLSPLALRAAVAASPTVGLGVVVMTVALAFETGNESLGRAATGVIRDMPAPVGELSRLSRLLALTMADPQGHAREIVPYVDALAKKPPDDVLELRIAALLPWWLDEPAAASTLIPLALERTRTDGDIGGTVAFLLALAFLEFTAGRWRNANGTIAEAITLARDTDQNRLAANATGLAAVLAAVQGRYSDAQALGASVRLISESCFGRSVAAWGLGLAALGEGRHEDAAIQLRQIFAPASGADHYHVAGWVIADFIEASLRTGLNEDLERLVERAEHKAEGGTSSRATLVARRARALLAGDDRARDLFELAISTPGAEDWPFELARTRLCFGEWLRRGRQIVAARPYLRASLETFTELGATPWAERARSELRAAGVKLTARRPKIIDELTPQQLQIAELAAGGLTNREIANRVFLSPKTVAFHLYNVYPKLQISTRAQLVHALAEARRLGDHPRVEN